MKVLLYNIRPEGQDYVDEWMKNHPEDELVTTPDDLTLETVDMAKGHGYDAVSMQQVPDVVEEEIYKRLIDYGIHHIALRTVGFDILNMDYIKKYHFLVTHTPAYSPRAVAENTLASTMYLLRHYGKILGNERKCDFVRVSEEMSDEIYHKTVGIIGVGRIGSAVAELFHALGATVIGNDLITNAANDAFLEYTDFDTVVREADILTLHTPLEPYMVGMIGAEQFKMMKDTAFIVNQARGPLIDTQALVAALKNHEIAGAAIDVFAEETGLFMKRFDNESQLPQFYRELSAMDNVIITPHSAFYTKTSVRNMVMHSMTDVKRVTEGKEPVYKLNY
ncbi:NAD(P)-dependent oxidoreductase [Bifidobacterium sp. ESL0769]|uniref:NAD(P)-dependent oxidoreductase n=1 Tax=Bifidobacterium sp. ESL0769 TaxID=2983229 RepID=UPI0023F9209B|nr:NAD(P)-dependent oxidoreductase [Bifidobacterium sp. ESL0769]WEV68232.1 NAD(P)-dependent oxidoreductase [Bifidobacterium sp. ESL0769]